MTKDEVPKPRKTAAKQTQKTIAPSKDVDLKAVIGSSSDTTHFETPEKRSDRAVQPSRGRRPLRWAIMAVLVVVVLAILGLGSFTIALYGFHWQGRVVDKVVSLLPFPAALASTSLIRYADYQSDVKTLNYYFDHNQTATTGQAKPGGEEIKATVLNRLIYDAVVARLVKQYNVQVTSADIDAQMKTVAQGANGDISALLNSLYGWTEAQFKEKVLRPYISLQKLDTLLTSKGILNGGVEKHAKDVLAKVQAGTTPFADLAKTYSEDQTASVGGDIGFFGKGETDAIFEAAVDKLKKGETSGLVKTTNGYEIIRLTDRIEDPAKGTQYRVSHILIRTKTIDDYVNEQVAKENVRLLLPGFSWDSANHWVVPVSKK